MAGERLMAVHAHPDDESSKGAATLARYAAEGHRVRVVTCTGGERGSILNPRYHAPERARADMPGVRREEMAASVSALGVEHSWLGFVDSGLPEGDPLPPLPEGCFAVQPLEVPTEALVREIREMRPHVLITYNEEGGYPHPDHLMTHRVSMAAVAAAADPERFPDAGEPWQVRKVYYDVGFSRRRIEALSEAMEQRGVVSPFGDWLAARGDRPEREVTTRVRVGEYFGHRDAALRAHATQIDPEGFFFLVPRDIEREVWPYDEFELAAAHVPVTLPEDDLFAGIDERLGA